MRTCLPFDESFADVHATVSTCVVTSAHCCCACVFETLHLVIQAVQNASYSPHDHKTIQRCRGHSSYYSVVVDHRDWLYVLLICVAQCYFSSPLESTLCACIVVQASWSTLKQLTSIDLDSNNFSGSLPVAWSRLSKVIKCLKQHIYCQA